MTDAGAYIMQVGSPIDYCRRWDNSLTTFDDYDAEAVSTDMQSAGHLLWEDTNDLMYMGSDETFCYVGFMMHTAGDYGAFALDYWNGAAWVDMTADVKYNGVNGFAKSGYLAWPVPGTWALYTVDGQSAYWLRARVASVTTAARFYNLLENVTLNPPLVLDPTDPRERISTDINTGTRKTDLPYTGPTRLLIECTHLALSMADMNLVHYWWEFRRKLRVYDPSQHLGAAGAISFALDSYYQYYVGRLLRMPARSTSPYKMDPDEYNLEFKIEAAGTLTAELGYPS